MSNYNDLVNAATNMLERLDKYIDRRVPDDGPDWEYTKLDDAMVGLRNAVRKAELEVTGE